MADAGLVQHPPAVKVGGRRLSISKPKHHSHTEQLQVEASTKEEPTDYPRPQPPPAFSAEESVEHRDSYQHTHYEEEAPRNEKKKYEMEKKPRNMKDRPTRDNVPVGGGGRRIDQPAGKGFIV